MRRFLVSTADKNYASQLKKQRLQEEEEDDPGKNNDIQEQDLPKLSEEPFSKSYLLDGKFFTVVKEDGLKLTLQCKNCPKIIQGQKSSTGNFLSHLKVTT